MEGEEQVRCTVDASCQGHGETRGEGVPYISESPAGEGGGTSSTPDGFHVPLYYSHTFLGLHFSSSTILDVSKLI